MTAEHFCCGLYLGYFRTCPSCDTPCSSELVGKLAEGPVPFAVGWFQRGDGKYAYSLRSRGEYDVSKLAVRYGGGGHRNAAGFQSDEPPDALFAKPVAGEKS